MYIDFKNLKHAGYHVEVTEGGVIIEPASPINIDTKSIYKSMEGLANLPITDMEMLVHDFIYAVEKRQLFNIL